MADEETEVPREARLLRDAQGKLSMELDDDDVRETTNPD